MAIRRSSGPTPQRPSQTRAADPQKAFQALKDRLQAAVQGPKGRERLSEAEARALIQGAEAGGPEVVKLLKDELAQALVSGRVGDEALTLSATTQKLLERFTGIEADASVTLTTPAEVGDQVRDDVAKAAAEKLLGVATAHKDVAGTGQESAARGDPRITERRSAVSTLIANKSSGAVSLDDLKALGPNVENDIKWLTAADRSDYKVDGGEQQFSWAKSDMTGAGKIEKQFKRRISLQKKQAEEFEAGTKKAFDASTSSVVGLSMITDAEKRADGLVDTLLQFRARTDKANQAEVTGGYYGDGSTRADEIAPALIAEQRILLASAQLDSSDPAKVKEYALLREVIASHPTSSVNGIFEARNAVGKLFMDGNTNYSSTTHEMAWIKTETAPGANTPAYKAIHHNFSRDTPHNIDATFRAFVLPAGPEERRGPLFLQLVNAFQAAEKGDAKTARALLKDLPAVDQATVKGLTDKLAGLADDKVAGAIGTFLQNTAQKPLAVDLRKSLEKAITDLGSSSQWTRDNALSLSGGAGEAFKEILEKAKAAPEGERAGILQAHLDSLEGPVSPSLSENLDMFARLYRSTCADQPSATTLEADLFKAGAAWPEVADVIAQLRSGNDLGALKDLGEARLALRDAIVGSDKGYERHELIKFDAQLSRLTNTELGAAVDRVGTLKTDREKAEALLGVQTALRSAVASGLHELRDPHDPAANKGEPLAAVLKDVDAALAGGKLDEADYRTLMSRVYVSVARTVQNIRSFVDSRAPDVAGLGAELDPEFLDQFVKQSPLHYATALAEKGMRAGLKEEIGPRCIKNIEGMRILNSVGPVVFDSVLFAENTKELVKLKPPKDAMSILFGLEEKKMVAVGGLIVDTEDAPGGNSHLNMYAMNNGITVLALPELRTRYAELFANASREGGLYVDDSNGEFRMMTVQFAIEEGIIKASDVANLAPGFNRKISYVKSQGVGNGFEQVGYHEAMVSPERKTREIELFIAMDEVNGIGRRCTSFKELATLGIHARHLAGEKGTVLALLKSNPKLADSVPDGSMVTTGRCRLLLEEAGIKEAWDSIWTKDPTVGTVDDTNFTKSAFYTDPDYRAEKRQWLQDLTKDKLTELLLVPPKNAQLPADLVQGELAKVKADDPHLTADQAQAKAEKKAMGQVKLMSNELARYDGAWPYETAELNPGGKSVKGDAAFLQEMETRFGRPLADIRKLVEEHAPTLTDAGKNLYNELRENPAMADSDNWITRSSFTGEDRPGKSGAGQYESFFHLKDPHSRIDGVIGVMESTWMPEPVENNVADEVNLQHIMPAVVVQHCLQPSESGVMISRDTEHGTRGQVYFQLVKGFGGGVEGGKTEEGTITASGHRVKIHHPDAPDGLVPAEDLKKLREIVLETENYFNEVVEKGKGYAVDMEVARVDGQWNVVQARVIQLDR